MFFFFNDTATTEIYTLSLHDALPISDSADVIAAGVIRANELPTPLVWIEHWPEETTEGQETFELVVFSSYQVVERAPYLGETDRKSTRLNSSHANISYAVFCLKKKKT